MVKPALFFRCIVIQPVCLFERAIQAETGGAREGNVGDRRQNGERLLTLSLQSLMVTQIAG
jgi:hypothetical protein